MRIGKLCAGVVALVVCAQPMAAGEIFICDDGRTLEVTSANREKSRNDPCVAEWFKRNGSKNAAPAKAADSAKKMSNDKWTTPDYSRYYHSWRSDPAVSYYTYDMPSW